MATRTATLREMQEVYSLEDLLDMNEAIEWYGALEAAAQRR